MGLPIVQDGVVDAFIHAPVEHSRNGQPYNGSAYRPPDRPETWQY